MNVDVCLLAYSKIQALWDMTQRCIDSLHASETKHKFNIMVMDSRAQINHVKPTVETLYHIKVFPGGFIHFMGANFPAPKGVKVGSLVSVLNMGIVWRCDWPDGSISTIKIPKDTPPQDKEFNGATTYKIDGPFNYNQSINYVIDRTSGPYLLVTNNDVVFNKGWFSEMLKVKGWDSASGWDNHESNNKHMKDIIKEGYKMCYHVRAHSIISTRKTIDTIGHFDETFDFYYQDDDYIATIKKIGLKHFHIGTAHIDHFHHGTTSSHCQAADHAKFLEGEKKFLAKWGKPVNEL